jgi:parallel beta-helix repeat protein/predicted outer membrane repeat protein
MNRTWIFSIVFVLLVYAVGWPTIINIPVDYPTIQQGIDASIDGDTVLVQPGTYVENINFNGHNIVLGSLFLTTGDTSYIEQTIIDGDSSGSVITFENGEDSTAMITGFTIQNGYANEGGGIKCDFNSNPIIKNNAICENVGLGSGGGIYCNNSDPGIQKNIVADNWSPGVEVGAGGGIYCGNSNSFIGDNIIIGNSATGLIGGGAGGGIFCIDSDLFIINNTINGNFAGSQGGGIYGFNSSITVNTNEIINNMADETGGGIYLFESDSVTLFGNRITLNNASKGGGIYLALSNSILSNNIFYNNSAGYYGGAICCEHSDATILNNTIYKNSAQFGGGIFTFYTSYPIITNTIFWADSAALGGDEIGGDDASWPTITYCDIKGVVWPGDGNIDADPLFRDPDNGDFHLMSIACDDSVDSPCIDVGDPSILDNPLNCSWGLGGIRSDMGAYGGEGSLSGLCLYVVGDANSSGAFNGLDVTYGVAYFKGGPPPPYECECTPGNIWYVGGDVNGSCSYNGLDITFAVAYFKGGQDPIPCPECPPAN